MSTEHFQSPDEAPQQSGTPRSIQQESLAFEALHYPRIPTPLSAELYNRAFNTVFVPASTEYRDPETATDGPMLYKTKELLLRGKSSFDSLLSVGAGTGLFDTDLASHLPLKQYIAVEPNALHAAQLRMNIAKHPWANTDVLEMPFDEKFSLPTLRETQFENVLLTHCVYFMKNPVAAIQLAKSLTTSDGAVTILHQGHEKGVRPFFDHFCARLGLQWDPDTIRQDHSMSTETLSKDLLSAGIEHFVGEEHAMIYIDSFFAADAHKREDVRLMLSFFMNTDVNAFPPAVREEMVFYIQNESIDVHGGRRKALEHPQGFLFVPNDACTFLPKNMKKAP